MNQYSPAPPVLPPSDMLHFCLSKGGATRGNNFLFVSALLFLTASWVCFLQPQKFSQPLYRGISWIYLLLQAFLSVSTEKFQSSSLAFSWRYPATRLISTQRKTKLLSPLPHKAFPRGSSLISQHPASHPACGLSIVCNEIQPP